MNAHTSRVFVVLATTLALAQPTYAKVRLDLIAISGGDLAAPLSITEQLALDLSNPWHGTIADWKADAPAPAGDRPVYDIALHARLRSPEVKPIYQLRYVQGKDGAPGLVYLPGRGEPGYRQNVSVIYREGHDGHWHLATPAWEARILRALGH
jgi:hypothetical protein